MSSIFLLLHLSNGDTTAREIPSVYNIEGYVDIINDFLSRKGLSIHNPTGPAVVATYPGSSSPIEIYYYLDGVKYDNKKQWKQTIEHHQNLPYIEKVTHPKKWIRDLAKKDYSDE